MTYSNVEVLIGKYDTDLLMKYTLHISFSIEGGRELLYDEITMVTSLNMDMRKDVVFIKVLNNKINA